MNRTTRCPKCHAGGSVAFCDLCAGSGQVTESVALMWTGATSTVRLEKGKVEELQALTIPSEPPTKPRRSEDDPMAVIERADRVRYTWLCAFVMLAVGLLALSILEIGRQ